jgi:hypothetical protein
MNMSNQGYPADSCIHANDIRKATRGSPYICGAGVNMEVWRDLRYEQMPCFLDKNGHSQPDAAHCPHLRCPTPEEIAAYEQLLKQNSENLRIVGAGIAGWRKAHKGQSASEVVECPACKGRLHLSIFYNGHVHGHCETEGCVSWRE